jgi:hypothetical protein
MPSSVHRTRCHVIQSQWRVARGVIYLDVRLWRAAEGIRGGECLESVVGHGREEQRGAGGGLLGVKTRGQAHVPPEDELALY